MLSQDEKLKLAEEELRNFKLNKSLKVQNGTTETIKNSFSPELSYYISRNKELEEVINQKNEQLDKLNGSIMSLNDKLDEMNQLQNKNSVPNDYLIRENEEKNNTISILIIEKTELQGKVFSLEQISAQRLSEIERLMLENTKLSSDLLNINDAYKDVLLQNSTLIENFNVLKEKFSEATEKINLESNYRMELEKELESVKNMRERNPSCGQDKSHRSYEEDNSKLLDFEKKFQDEFVCLNKEITRLTNLLNLEGKKSGDLIKNQETLLLDLDRSTTEVKSLKNEIKCLQEKLAVPSKVLTSVDASCEAQLSGEKISNDATLESLINENQTLVKANETMKEACSKYKEEISHYEQVTSDYEELMKQLDGYRSTITTCMKQNDQLKEEKITRDEELSNLKVELVKMKELSKQVSSDDNNELISLRHRLEELKTINETLVLQLEEKNRAALEQNIPLEEKPDEEQEMVLKEDRSNVTETPVISPPIDQVDDQIKKNYQLLESKFICLMDRLANITDAKENLEYVCTHLEMEADTIVDYITLYTHTRNEALKRATFREGILKEYMEEKSIIMKLIEQLLSTEDHNESKQLISSHLDLLKTLDERYRYFEFGQEQADDANFIPPLDYNNYQMNKLSQSDCDEKPQILNV